VPPQHQQTPNNSSTPLNNKQQQTTNDKQSSVTFSNLRGVMLSALPRVYEEAATGAAVPSEPEPTLIGGDVQVERLTGAAAEARKRLDVEVAQPIRQWTAAYRTVAERLKRLESLRLELDSRRRTVAELQGKVERVRANLGTTRAKGEADMEATLRRMQHKEDKMARCAAAYGEAEATLHNSLFTLIKDTSVLRDYAAAAILIVQEAFASGYAAFEPPMMGAGQQAQMQMQMQQQQSVAGGVPQQQQQQAPTAYAPAAPVPPMNNAGGSTAKYAATGKAPAANEAKVRKRQETRQREKRVLVAAPSALAAAIRRPPCRPPARSSSPPRLPPAGPTAPSLPRARVCRHRSPAPAPPSLNPTPNSQAHGDQWYIPSDAAAANAY